MNGWAEHLRGVLGACGGKRVLLGPAHLHQLPEVLFVTDGGCGAQGGCAAACGICVDEQALPELLAHVYRDFLVQLRPNLQSVTVKYVKDEGAESR